VLTADIGSHVDTFLELVADDHDDESAVDVTVYISGNFWEILNLLYLVLFLCISVLTCIDARLE
jgi:hypothetical protein